MKKVFIFIFTLLLLIGITFPSSYATAEEEFPAAPYVAGVLLEAQGIDNRYGTGRNGGNYIASVAQHMEETASFNGVQKTSICEYEYEVAEFLNQKLADEGDSRRVIPRLGTFDPVASTAVARDNNDGTVTLEISVVDLCGYGISDLDPINDFYVMDSLIGGPYYFGTGSIPGSDITEWENLNGVYTVTLVRNLFNSRPAGYINGWYRIWDIYVNKKLIQDNLELKTTFSMVGTWDVILYMGATAHARFITINEQTVGTLYGLMGTGTTTQGNITGSIDAQNLSMYYDREGFTTTGYFAEFAGHVADDGNTAFGTWKHGENGVYRTDSNLTWVMTRK